MAELRKRKWNSQCCATLWQGNLHKVAAPYFCFMYIVQMYEEDWGILHMFGCWAIAPPVLSKWPTDKHVSELSFRISIQSEEIHTLFTISQTEENPF